MAINYLKSVTLHSATKLLNKDEKEEKRFDPEC